MNASRPSALDPSRTKREPSLRPRRGRHRDVQYFYQTKAHFSHVTLSGPHEPCVYQAQEHDVIGHFHPMSQEVAELAPRWICDDPVHRLSPIHEVCSIVDFAFLALTVESPDECFPSGTRFKYSPAWTKVIHDHACCIVWGIYSVIPPFGSKRTRVPNKSLHGTPRSVLVEFVSLGVGVHELMRSTPPNNERFSLFGVRRPVRFWCCCRYSRRH